MPGRVFLDKIADIIYIPSQNRMICFDPTEIYWSLNNDQYSNGNNTFIKHNIKLKNKPDWIHKFTYLNS